MQAQGNLPNSGSYPREILCPVAPWDHMISLVPATWEALEFIDPTRQGPLSAPILTTSFDVAMQAIGEDTRNMSFHSSGTNLP